MSKVAKNAQDYNAKPKWPICSNCKHFTLDKVPTEWNPSYLQEKNLRCEIGKFAVKKTATCSYHELLTEQKELV